MTKPISLKQYCPYTVVPLSKDDMLLAQVQKEDWINHINDPVPSIPKFKEIKVNWTTATWHAFREEIKNLMRP